MSDSPVGTHSTAKKSTAKPRTPRTPRTPKTPKTPKNANAAGVSTGERIYSGATAGVRHAIANAESTALHPPDATRVALRDSHMQSVLSRMNMAVGVFAVVHAAAPTPNAVKPNVRRQATKVPQGDKTDTPTTKRRKTANAGVRKGKNTDNTDNCMGDMDSMDCMGDRYRSHDNEYGPLDTNHVNKVAVASIFEQLMFVRDKYDDFRQLDFGQHNRVKNWSLSRWGEKDNEELVVPHVDWDWPESDDEVVT